MSIDERLGFWLNKAQEAHNESKMEVTKEELRLGNWLESEAGYFQVNIIAHDTVIKNVKPIPITEYILLKAGFMLMPYGWYKRGLVGYSFDHGILEIGEPMEIGHVYIDRPIFLHDLQNIYYQLFKKELIIKL